MGTAALSLRQTLEAYLGRLKGSEFSVASEAWSRADAALREANAALEQAERHQGQDSHHLTQLWETVALAEEDLVAAEELLRAIGDEIKDTESALAALPPLGLATWYRHSDRPCTPLCG